jgi:AcrR family transcriptional regulator
VARSAPRERVLDAAARLFREHGYVDTTIGAIARDAGVALGTIYSGFGAKVGILAAIQDRAVAGGGGPLLDQDWARAPSRREVVARFAAATERVAPVQRILAGAAADPAVGRLLETLHEQRITTCREIAARLGATDPERLADELYALLGVEAYELFVVRRGWTRDAWAAFVERALDS